MILNNLFVMNCTLDVLGALAVAVGVVEDQVKALMGERKGPKKLRAIVGTKLAQGETREAYDAGTLLVQTLAYAALDAALAVDAWEAAHVDAKAWDDAHKAQEAPFNPDAAADAEYGPARHQATSGKRDGTKSAKTWLRELLSVPGATYTLAQLCAATGKTEVNIRTMLSDLRSVKYAGSAGVFNTKSTRVDGKTLYSKA